MNTVKSLWNLALEHKIYIDLVLLSAFCFGVFFLLQYAAVKFAMYLVGCWVVGGKLGSLSYWLAKKLK